MEEVVVKVLKKRKYHPNCDTGAFAMRMSIRHRGHKNLKRFDEKIKEILSQYST